MGTQVIIKAVGENRPELERAVQDAFEEISRLEQMMSNFIPTSELSRINQQAGKAPVPVSRELFSVIQKSLYFSELTEGTFDISFASVGKLWDFRAGILPSPEAIARQLPFVDYRKIRLNEKDSSVYLPYPEMEIGLGGIGKGYAVDRAMDVITKHGIHDAVVMAGGDMLVKGKKGKDLWRVGLRDPDDKNKILAVLPLEDQAVSTSGDYERFFIKDGVRYHHIIDTKTGYPARLCRSVTLLAKDATTTDGLTKGVFILGPERGMALIERIGGVEAIIIDAQGKMHLSAGLTSLKSEGAKNGK
jgi:thiamine biosynthesis lipoprotein